MAIDISPGERHESKWFVKVMDLVRVRTKGAPKQWPSKLAGDKGYSSPAIRKWLKDRGITPVISHRKDEPGRYAGDFDRVTYRKRNIVERCVGWIKELRRIATRYEKLGIHYLGMLKLGMIREWLKTR
jgi:transposase